MNQLIISRKDALAQGLKFYFTGKPCSNGHVCERDVAEWRCLECRKAKAARKYQREAPERSAKKRERYATDPEYREAYKAKSAQWQKDNPERYRARLKKYQQDNREVLLEKKKASNDIRRRDPEVVARERETSRLWREANPEKKRSHVRNRRARKREAEGFHTDADIREIWDRQSGLCNYCQSDLTEVGHHVDHIIAVTKGGSNWPSNLQCLCPDCNRRKWNLSEDEFFENLARR